MSSHYAILISPKMTGFSTHELISAPICRLNPIFRANGTRLKLTFRTLPNLPIPEFRTCSFWHLGPLCPIFNATQIRNFMLRGLVEQPWVRWGIAGESGWGVTALEPRLPPHRAHTWTRFEAQKLAFGRDGWPRALELRDVLTLRIPAKCSLHCAARANKSAVSHHNDQQDGNRKFRCC